jgi:ATP-dependent helicase HrpB
MIFEAADAGCAQRACLLAAALTEAASEASLRHETDARRLLDRLDAPGRDGFAHRVRELARRWGSPYPATDRARLSEGLLLAWAFPDRIARRRDASGHYLLRSGRGATLDTAEPLPREEWLVAAELQDDAADAKIRLAAPLTREELDEAFGAEYESRALISWDRRAEAVQAVNRLCLGAIVIREGGQAEPDPESLRAALFEGVRQKGIGQLPWSKSARALQERVCFLHRTLPDSDWPDFSDDALLASLDAWLGPFCDGVTRWSHVQALDLTGILLGRLDACGCSRRALDELAPTHLPVPSGSNVQVRYDQDAPYLAVRIQEVFGMTRTPKIAGGRVPVVMHLLSPAQRPVQVTRDLESFWATGYAFVRKDLRGRYPKHYWPEDPREATATRRVRPPSG